MNGFFSLMRKRITLSWVILFFCFDLLYEILLWLKPFGQVGAVAVDSYFGFFGVIVALPICFIGLRRLQHASTLFLGLGILAFGIGQGLWAYYNLVLHQSPFPSTADIAYLSSYPLILLGIFLLPIHRLANISRTRMVLDGLIIMTGILTFSWYFILGPTILHGSGTPLARIIGTAYPFNDLVLVFCVFMLWMNVDIRQLRTIVLLLSLGLLSVALADIAFDYMNLQDTFTTAGSLTNAFWPLGYQLIALAAYVLQRFPKVIRSNVFPPVQAGSGWRILLPYAFLPLLAGLLCYAWRVPGSRTLQVGLYIGAATFVCLIVIRQVIAIRELRAMYANNDRLAQANTQLALQATHDSLTGLPNRELLWKQLEHLLTQKDQLFAALLLLDLDHFKEINDTLGHRVGDLLLQQIGPRLSSCLSTPNLIARLGGDEFAVLLSAATAEEAIQVALTVLASFDVPFLIEEHTLTIGGSIGIALISQDGLDAMTLLRRADMAMYAAKRNQGGYAIYTPEIDQSSPQKLALMGELRQALKNDDLRVYYQPKISLLQGEMIGVEALVRWQHPVRGLIPPDVFIPQAEKAGLIGPLTRWVLKRTLQQCKEWQQIGLHINVAVNLSARSLYDPQLLPMVKELLEKYKVAPEYLTLEVTENTFMEDPEPACVVLNSLRAMGISIALDDFGTGYSSLSYLKRLPLDEIKIDKSFVLGLGKDAALADIAIVKAVVAMARPLQSKVVAEGVETLDAEIQLHELGCDLAQGYYFSRPVPAAALTAWAQTNVWGMPQRQEAAAS